MKYQVLVGNIGTVYDGDDKTVAEQTFIEYSEQSLSDVGRAGGEEVTLFEDGEILFEYTPAYSSSPAIVK